MTVLALVNQKGGVGKTTVSLALAAVAAKAGLGVTVVDIDPQANATTGMGVWKTEATVEAALAADTSVGLSDVVVPSGWDEFFDNVPLIVPASAHLVGAETQLATDPIGAQDRLSRSMAGLRDDPATDLVLIDCPPSLGLLTVNGLFAADRAVIVTEPSAWAVDGVAHIKSNIERISERRDGALTIGGVVVNRLGRTRDARYWDGELVSTYGAEVIRPAIAARAVVAEASAQSRPITSMDRSGSDKALAEFTAVLHAVVPELIGAPRDEL